MPQTQTDYSAVTIIVVKLTARSLAESAAQTADPDGGAGTFHPGIPLRKSGDATNTVVAVWARWNMKPSQRSVFASTMGGPNNIYAAGATVAGFDTNRDRWFFDATEGAWTGAQVLSALGLDTLAIDEVDAVPSPPPPNWP